MFCQRDVKMTKKQMTKMLLKRAIERHGDQIVYVWPRRSWSQCTKYCPVLKRWELCYVENDTEKGSYHVVHTKSKLKISI